MNLYFTHPTENPEYPEEIMDKSKTLFYPENTMSVMDQCKSSRPAHFHVVTNCPWFIALYEREEVFVWNKEEKKWENPEFWTYGTSITIIMEQIVGYHNSIPQAVIDGKVTNCMGHKIKETIKKQSAY